MFTDLEIKVSTSRSFVEFYYDGARVRIASGKLLGLPIYPNRAKKDSDRKKLLERLKYELQKALEKGWNPLQPDELNKLVEISLEAIIRTKLEEKLQSQLSRTYKRDLESMAVKLLSFLTPREKQQPASKLSASRISEFLMQFASSNGNYMNKRKTLNVLLPATTSSTKAKRTTETLHAIYTKEQLNKVLNFLKEHYPRLHLLALLCYGCLLRPHEEARLLQKRHFVEGQIVLAGFENKGKKVRVVHIPNYVHLALKPYLQKCTLDHSYLFTGTDWLLNNYYFNTQWGRAKEKMLTLKLLHAKQTLYSFRHTAAVNVYRKTKDVYVVQKILGHGSVMVTLKYLRGLGEMNNEELRDAAPEL